MKALQTVGRLVHALILSTLLISGTASCALAGASATTPHVQVQLLAQADGATDIWAVIDFRLIPHWHVYWRNPGDSGDAPRVTWRLPTGWSAGEIQWPVPRRIPVGPFVNYGYEDRATLLVPLNPAPGWDGSGVSISAHLDWLVCKEECIPENAVLSTRIEGGATHPETASLIRDTQAQLPIPLEHPARYTLSDGTIELRISGLDWPAERIEALWFAAHQWGPVSAAGRQRFESSDSALTLTIPGGDAPPDGSATLDGLLVLEEKSGTATQVRGFTLTARPATADTGTMPPDENSPPPERPAPGPADLLLTLAGALLGGIILNLMPCVFPILSMKIIGLVEAPRTQLRRHAGAYSSGVILSFLAMGLTLMALRAGGDAVGWGFQLQSPLVVLGLSCLMLLIALNLSGVFEIGTRIMGLAPRGHDRSASGHGLGGAFATGVLAVVVASPCTAPFMGAAIGLALTLPAAASLLIFASLGVGFALPLVLIAITPALARHLPRPGPWMVRLRELLAFPLYGTAAWLLWVLSQQTDAQGLALALGILVSVAFGAWLWGLHGRARWLAPAVFGVVTLILFTMPLTPSPPPAANGGPGEAQAWSAERVLALREQGHPVLVNFTADWCITCKVNERVALSRPAVREALRTRNIAYLKGDWTRHDEHIARELERHGRNGVPLYLLYPRGEDKPLVLPQILSEGIILEAFERIDATNTGR